VPAVLTTLFLMLLFIGVAVLVVVAPFFGLGFALWKRHKRDEELSRLRRLNFSARSPR
jgi:hypothetical protein